MIHIHHIDPFSRANGPGMRFTIWFQGCSIGCTGCFNPRTHGKTGGRYISVEQLLQQIKSNGTGETISGVSISGGEPFQQAPQLMELVTQIKKETDLTILIYSGYTLEEIRAMDNGKTILESVDCLIAGPFRKNLKTDEPAILTSSNQRLHLFTDAVTLADFEALPLWEITITKSGVITISGYAPMEFPDIEQQAATIIPSKNECLSKG